ncbi:DNA replication factor Dna2-domain-containing protein, partial [Phycomyces nitens]
KQVLVLMDNDENKPVHAHVRQDWLETTLCIGDTIHIPLNGKDRPLSIIIDNENNYIITCPDNLIPITTIVNSFICLRKSVLQQKNARSMKYTQALVHGDIMHQVFQYGLKTSDFSEDGLCTELMRVIKASLIPLSAIDQDEEEAFAIMKGDLGAIKAFGDIYIGPEPKPDATLSDNVDKQFKRKLDIDTISISRVLDIEENLWSPTYGIKGMIDATIQLETSPDKKTLIIPFELKTGKGTKDIFHCAQTLLYTLLMSDRYDIPIDLGALFYSRSNRLFLLPALRNELMSLIITRNDLAFALEQETLPPMIKSLHNCQNCDMANTCLTNHKAIEGGNGITSGLDGWFDKNTDQLTLEDAAFFRHWHKLIDLEEDNSNYMRKDIWIQPAELRELNGTCLNNMRMKIPLNSENGRFTRSFYRDPEYQVDKSIKELSDSQIEHGDTVIISSIDGHVNLGSGTVVSIGPENIVIRFYNPLRRAPKKDLLFDEASNQVFEKILPDAINNDFYRIDKDFLPSGLGVLRQNIVTLVSKEENGGDEKRKRLIVDLATPAFINNSSAPPHSIPGLNSDQQLAVNKVLSAKDYALILGMPGTGKTTTTAHIIKELVARNKTVLVAAYTHIAIDNVLMKVKQSGVEVLRIGKYAQVRINTFVLVGDQYQLSPVIKNNQANNGGLGKSLFNLLAEAHPQSIVYLKYQYRMNKDIMQICNTFVYDNKLKCGSNAIAASSLEIPRINQVLDEIHQPKLDEAKGISLCSGSPCWLKDILDPR